MGDESRKHDPFALTEGDDDLDVGALQRGKDRPRSKPAPEVAEAVRETAQKSGFTSRETPASTPAPKPKQPDEKISRQLSYKATEADVALIEAAQDRLVELGFPRKAAYNDSWVIRIALGQLEKMTDEQLRRMAEKRPPLKPGRG